MWRELIQRLHPTLEPYGGSNPGPEFFAGATSDELADIERRLSVQLPESLQSLLVETNGALVNYGTHLIWSTDEIAIRNQTMRTDEAYRETYMPFDNLLFFADAGVDGLLFAFGIVQGAIRREHVYLWNPLDDGRDWKAPSLRTYIEWWLDGKLTV